MKYIHKVTTLQWKPYFDGGNTTRNIVDRVTRTSFDQPIHEGPHSAIAPVECINCV